MQKQTLITRQRLLLSIPTRFHHTQKEEKRRAALEKLKEKTPSFRPAPSTSLTQSNSIAGPSKGINSRHVEYPPPKSTVAEPEILVQAHDDELTSEDVQEAVHTDSARTPGFGGIYSLIDGGVPEYPNGKIIL